MTHKDSRLTACCALMQFGVSVQLTRIVVTLCRHGHPFRFMGFVPLDGLYGIKCFFRTARAIMPPMSIGRRRLMVTFPADSAVVVTTW